MTKEPALQGFDTQELIERSPQRLFVLKEGDAFLVADIYGDVTGAADGLFVNDTRLLSTFRLRFGGRRPSLLSGGVRGRTCWQRVGGCGCEEEGRNDGGGLPDP